MKKERRKNKQIKKPKTPDDKIQLPKRHTQIKNSAMQLVTDSQSQLCHRKRREAISCILRKQPDTLKSRDFAGPIREPHHGAVETGGYGAPGSILPGGPGMGLVGASIKLQ